MTGTTVYVVSYRLRCWEAGVDVYATRAAAEAAILDFASESCAYDGDDVDAALDAIADHDHEFSLHETEVQE